MMMALIPLSQGYFAIVDDELLEDVSQFKWSALVAGKQFKRVYAFRQIRRDGKAISVYLHRYIMQAPPGFDVDHINDDGLDNRRSNLRVVTRAQNVTRGRSASVTGYRGVSIDRNRFLARCDDKYIGKYRTPEEAARAYDAVAIKLYGEFARLNFPNGFAHSEQGLERLA